MGAGRQVYELAVGMWQRGMVVGQTEGNCEKGMGVNREGWELPERDAS
jgi:hypothetical protein